MGCGNDQSPIDPNHKIDSTPTQDLNTPDVLEVEITEPIEV